MHIVPAVLPESNKVLTDEITLLAAVPGVTQIQIDVVDGLFATPASWPYNVPGDLEDMLARAEALPHTDRIVYEIDLMCVDAERAATAWLALGATRLTFHAESGDVPHLLASMRERGAGQPLSLGIAVSIESDLELVEPWVGEVDYVQFMGIKTIGRQGEPFDARVIERVRSFHARHPAIPLQVDGGVSLDNAPELIAAGVSSLIVGSAIVRAPDPAAAFAAFNLL